jgi:hypothetical protein
MYPTKASGVQDPYTQDVWTLLIYYKDDLTHNSIKYMNSNIKIKYNLSYL